MRVSESNWLLLVLVSLAALIPTPSARAAFHLNGIEEIYTDSTGTLQYIQFYSAFSSQQFVAGQQITCSNIGATQTHVLTLPNNLPGDTLNKHWLIGTAGIQAAGAPAPDFIMPDNFLFSLGGSINFFGANSGSYSALPTDGNLARIWGAGNTPNIAENFAGQVGSVVVPEPTAGLLLGSIVVLCRRRAQRA